MALIYITLRIMPESIEADLPTITAEATKMIHAFIKEDRSVQAEYKPVAFGLKAIELMWSMQESIGGTEDLEAEICNIENVQNCECVDVRRAIG